MTRPTSTKVLFLEGLAPGTKYRIDFDTGMIRLKFPSDFDGGIETISIKEVTPEGLGPELISSDYVPGDWTWNADDEPELFVGTYEALNKIRLTHTEDKE